MSWTINDSHKWVDVPHTRYERLRELRVRGCRQTAMVIAFRYQNIDTGKYDTDKIKTISSMSLASEMSGSHFNGGYSGSRYSFDDIEETVSFVNDGERRITIPTFVPKDDDFELEERRLAEQKKKKDDEISYQARVVQRERELAIERKAKMVIGSDSYGRTVNCISKNTWIPK
jgi:hypothetical protein